MMPKFLVDYKAVGTVEVEAADSETAAKHVSNMFEGAEIVEVRDSPVAEPQTAYPRVVDIDDYRKRKGSTVPPRGKGKRA